MEIVPDSESIAIEAQLSPQDRAEVQYIIAPVTRVKDMAFRC